MRRGVKFSVRLCCGAVLRSTILWTARSAKKLAAGGVESGASSGNKEQGLRGQGCGEDLLGKGPCTSSILMAGC